MEEHFFRKCNDTKCKLNREKGYMYRITFYSLQIESILVYKLVTVNCLSQYSGCKCILT